MPTSKILQVARHTNDPYGATFTTTLQICDEKFENLETRKVAELFVFLDCIEDITYKVDKQRILIFLKAEKKIMVVDVDDAGKMSARGMHQDNSQSVPSPFSPTPGADQLQKAANAVKGADANLKALAAAINAGIDFDSVGGFKMDLPLIPDQHSPTRDKDHSLALDRYNRQLNQRYSNGDGRPKFW